MKWSVKGTGTERARVLVTVLQVLDLTAMPRPLPTRTMVRWRRVLVVPLREAALLVHLPMVSLSLHLSLQTPLVAPRWMVPRLLQMRVLLQLRVLLAVAMPSPALTRMVVAVATVARRLAQKPASLLPAVAPFHPCSLLPLPLSREARFPPHLLDLRLLAILLWERRRVALLARTGCPLAASLLLLRSTSSPHLV
jgi:hypothetical protein